MNPRRIATAARRAALVAAVVALASTATNCETKLYPVPVANLLPVVRLTSAPIDTTHDHFYSVTLHWIGNDPDGRVDHYLYAIDPPEAAAAETSWTLTRASEHRQTFSAARAAPAPDTTRSREFHTFVIVAVDNHGALGPRVYRDFYSYTIAPTVRVAIPSPSKLSTRSLTPSVRITWAGEDLDGVFTDRPVRYRYRLVNLTADLLPGGESARELVLRPWLIRTYYAPDFATAAGWIQTGAETTFVQFTNLNPGNEYLFIVVAFDEAGAHTPSFSLETNLLRFKVGYAGAHGPILTLFNEYFFYRYPGGSYYPGPQAWINLEVPAGQAVRFNWSADAPAGADIRSYRWMLDGDVYDETPRSEESSDFVHWSARSRNITTAVVGPFPSGEHFFFVEAEDNTGLRSLGVVHFYPVQASLERPLLIVNDTRFRTNKPDAQGYYRPATGPWPEAPELDTLLFAHGGWPWEGRRPGIQSTPGMLKGYPFTAATYPLGSVFRTRNGRSDLTVPLSVLGKYQHVLWIVDGTGANYTKNGTDLNQPETALRYMSNVSRVNTLAAYVKQGGRVWLAGGGGAMATTQPHNDNTNDQPTTTFSSLTSTREVRPGRFMYDLVKWQSEYRIASAPAKPRRYLGRHDEARNPGVYALLPDSLEPKSPATDTLPPERNASDFYQAHFSLEFLQRENIVTEALQTDPADLQIDGFEFPTTADLVKVWKSSDATNTVVVSADAGVSGRAMRVQTQGGGGSTGDRVRRTFTGYRDWSGLTQLRFAVRQDQPTSAVQWRVRIVDEDGGGLVAPVPWDGTGFKTVTIPRYGLTAEIGRVPSLTRVAAIEFELVRGDAPGITEFDQIAISATFEVPVLDTLYEARGGGNTTLPRPDENPHNVVMTYYHGHDTTPFVFSGFSLWNFKRTQLVQLIDFVFQRMWGLTRTTGAPALRAERAAPPQRGIVRGGVTAGKSPAAAVRQARRLDRGQQDAGGALKPNRGSAGRRDPPGRR